LPLQLKFKRLPLASEIVALLIVQAQGISFPLVAGLIFMKFDPLHSYVHNDSESLLQSVLVISLRYVLVAIPAYTFDSFINLFLLVFFIQLSKLSLFIATLTEWSATHVKNCMGKSSSGNVFYNKVSEIRSIKECIKSYVKLQLIVVSTNEIHSTFAPSLIAFGGFLMVLCNYACVKMFGDVILFFILAFMGISLCCIILTATMLPLAEGLFESSRLFLSNTGTVVGKHGSLSRQVGSLRPCRIQVCPLFHAKRSTKSTYFDICFQYTINALLMY